MLSGPEYSDNAKKEAQEHVHAWQQHLEKDDDLLCTFLDSKQRALEDLSYEQHRPPPSRQPAVKHPETEARMVDKDKQLDTLLYALSEAKHDVDELGERAQGIHAEVAPEEGRLIQTQHEVERASKLVPARAAPVKTKSGPPVVLVMVNASTAPFGLSKDQHGAEWGETFGQGLRYQVELDVREHDIQLDDPDSSAPVAIVGLVFQNKDSLVQNLVKNEVIRLGKDWDAFQAGFQRRASNQFIDVGSAVVEEKMAGDISLEGEHYVRIYLAGVNVNILRSYCKELQPSPTSAYRKLAEKIVIVNHRETDLDRESLAESGWRVTVFRRYFASQYGLGTDQGWGFRATTPPVGPGDQNHADGDDSDGHSAILYPQEVDHRVKVGWMGKNRWEV
ncbi:hypothetical protein JCM8097_005907 [Rhodosporidiobolus ruineniae]